MTGINIKNLPSELQNGFNEYIKKYAQDVSTELNVTIEPSNEKKLKIKRSGSEVLITVCENVHIFRALTLLLINIEDENYSCESDVYFDFDGVMLDFSHGADFPTVKNLKTLLLIFAAWGMNKFLLYVEDCMNVPGEPFIGYMRPKYTELELKEIDDFAFSLGIEVIPCVQSLSHLPSLLQWRAYSDIAENESTLLVGAERTYELIEKMFKAITKPLRTKTIHVGLDEAEGMGKGKYLRINEPRPQIDIFSEHLRRVKAIAEGLGLYPLIWNDMYFRTSYSAPFGTGRNHFISPDEEIAFKPEHTPPSGVGYVWWDYHHADDYTGRMLEKNRALFEDLYFAGACATAGVSTFRHTFSKNNSNAALNGCKRINQRKVFCTVWGDDVRDMPVYTVLAGIVIYAEHCFNLNVNESETDRIFKFTVGTEMKNFDALSYLDIIEGHNSANANPWGVAPTRSLLYQDVLLGMCDSIYEGYDLAGHYRAFAEKIAEIGAQVRSSGCDAMFCDAFDYYYYYARFMELKGDIGIKLKRAYDAKNMKELAHIAESTIPQALERGREFSNAHKRLFYNNFKPIGYEIHDIRIGGVLERLKTAKLRIEGYLSGLGNLDELEEDRSLHFNGASSLAYSYYKKVASATEI